MIYPTRAFQTAHVSAFAAGEGRKFLIDIRFPAFLPSPLPRRAAAAAAATAAAGAYYTRLLGSPLPSRRSIKVTSLLFSLALSLFL